MERWGEKVCKGGRVELRGGQADDGGHGGDLFVATPYGIKASGNR